MRNILLIAACFLIDVVLWVGMMAAIVSSPLELHWMLFASFFGGCLIVSIGGLIFKKFTDKPKKRHATRIDKNNPRFVRANT
jgi:hypothetical protein